MKIITIKNIGLISLTLLVSACIAVSSVSAATFTPLTAQLDYGQTSNNVTNLQMFLASNSSIYPQGRITGYFGPLTKSAVMNFQNAFGIPQVGRVGPTTLAKINSLIASGANLAGINGGGNIGDVNAPIIYSPSISTSSNGATIGWSTNEPATAEIYYGTSPFQLVEAVGNGEPTIGGASSTGDTTSLQTTENVSLQNLQPNTMYYYMIESTDGSGNLQYTWPTTFVTRY